MAPPDLSMVRAYAGGRDGARHLQPIPARAGGLPVPSRNRQPRAAAGTEPAAGRDRRRPVVEEPVDGRAGAADIRPEGAQLAQLVRQRRAREVVRRERGEVARAADASERLEQRRPPVLEPLGAVAPVELLVDRGGGWLLRAVRQDEEDEEVLRQVERSQHAALARAELRA